MPIKEKASPPLQKTVLAVDDVAENLLTIKMILKGHYDVCLAKSSGAAREVLERTTVDLILLDIEMPGKNGFEFLDEIQQVTTWKSIPVIFVTAAATASFVNRAASAGAAGYIVKPINHDVLLSRVDDIFLDAFLKQLGELECFCATGRADRVSAMLNDVVRAFRYIPSTVNESVTMDNIAGLAKTNLDFQAAAEKIRLLMEMLRPSK